MTGSVFELPRAFALAFLTATTALAQPAASHAISIKDGSVPREQRVLKVLHESLVRIEWSSDRVMTVHLEGYGLSLTVQPGRSAVMEFKAVASGRFAVHAHEGQARGGSSTHAYGRSALLRLEVHPQ